MYNKSIIDIDALGSDIPSDALRVTESTTKAEDPKLLDHRLKMEMESAQHERKKDLILFSLGCVAIVTVFVFCLIIISTSQVEADKKWSYGVIGSIAGGLTAYLVRPKP